MANVMINTKRKRHAVSIGEFTCFSLNTQHKWWKFWICFGFSTFVVWKFGSFCQRIGFSFLFQIFDFISWFLWTFWKFYTLCFETHTFVDVILFSSRIFLSFSSSSKMSSSLNFPSCSVFYFIFSISFLLRLFLQVCSFFCISNCLCRTSFPLLRRRLFLLFSVYCTQSKFNYWHYETHINHCKTVFFFCLCYCFNCGVVPLALVIGVKHLISQRCFWCQVKNFDFCSPFDDGSGSGNGNNDDVFAITALKIACKIINK